MNRIEGYNSGHLLIGDISEQKQCNGKLEELQEESTIFLEKKESDWCCEKMKGVKLTDRKVLKVKAHEAEDAIVKQRPPLRRTFSTSHLNDTCLEKPEAKNGAIWQCLSWKHDTYGGRLYTFKKKPQYEKGSVYALPEAKKQMEIYQLVKVQS